MTTTTNTTRLPRAARTGQVYRANVAGEYGHQPDFAARHEAMRWVRSVVQGGLRNQASGSVEIVDCLTGRHVATVARWINHDGRAVRVDV